MNTNIPIRTPWQNFPPAILHAVESLVKKHPHYQEAKAGSADAAFALVTATTSDKAVAELKELIQGRQAILVSAHAFEKDGVNAIPEAFADELGRRLGIPTDDSVVQINVVGHTGANGFARMARQAIFDGTVIKGANYVLVDDFIGQGGTLANMKGFIEAEGGIVIGATVLTGKPYSAILTPTQEQLAGLREKHGKDFEDWWRNKFSHGFDCLTQSEARYLARTEDVNTIRNRLAAEE